MVHCEYTVIRGLNVQFDGNVTESYKRITNTEGSDLILTRHTQFSLIRGGGQRRNVYSSSWTIQTCSENCLTRERHPDRSFPGKDILQRKTQNIIHPRGSFGGMAGVGVVRRNAGRGWW